MKDPTRRTERHEIDEFDFYSLPSIELECGLNPGDGEGEEL